MRRKEIFTTVSNKKIEIKDLAELIQQQLTKKQDKNDRQKISTNSKCTT
jgi:hypothetical protein